MFFFLLPSGATAHSVHFQKLRVLNVPVNLLTVDLNDPHVKVSVELAAGFPGCDEPFMAMVQRSGAEAAVTGTYFCTTSLYPIGDIVIDGRLRYFGGMGTALAITPTNEAIFRRVPYGRHQSWNGFETVVAAGPTLLRNGQIDLHPWEERFGDPHVLSRAARTAVGWTPANKLLFVAILQPLSLRELAKIFRRLGCVHAVNLDGGSSTALYYAGVARVNPQRRLVNIIVIHSGVPGSLRFALSPDERELRTRKRLEYAAILYARGEAAALRGDWNLAIKHYRTASRLASDNASYYLALARALNAIGRQAERATVLAEAGRAFMRKGAWRQAEAQFRQALHLNPIDIPTRRLLAQVLTTLGERESANMQIQTGDRLQLAMTSPIGTLSSARRLEQSIRTLPAPTWRASPGGEWTTSQPLHGKFSESKGIFGLVRHFWETRWDFRIQLRGEWRFSQSPDKTTLYLRHAMKGYQGIVRVFPAPKSLTLVAFQSQYHSGQFHVEDSMRVFSRDGAYGIESHCRTLMAGEPMVNRCVLIRHKRSIIALSLSAKAAAGKDANREFDAIVKSLRFGQ